MESRINITNIRGVAVVGDGNVVNTTFTDLSRVLTDMKQAVLNEPLLQDNQKLNVVADIDALPPGTTSEAGTAEVGHSGAVVQYREGRRRGRRY